MSYIDEIKEAMAGVPGFHILYRDMAEASPVFAILTSEEGQAPVFRHAYPLSRRMLIGAPSPRLRAERPKFICSW